MGFTWTQNISVGATIDTADIQELRTNVDWLDDNKCTTVNSSEKTNHDHSEDAAAWNTVYTTVDSLDFIGVYSTERTGFEVGDHGADRVPHNSGDESYDEYSYDSGAATGYNSFAQAYVE